MEPPYTPLLCRFLATESVASNHTEELKRDVLENIRRILQATKSSVTSDARRPLVQQSILNFGIPAFVGAIDKGVTTRQFSQSIRTALLAHEPRIDASSLEVSVNDELDPEEIIQGEFRLNITAEVKDLGSDRRLTIQTLIHPFRVPEILSSTQAST